MSATLRLRRRSPTAGAGKDCQGIAVGRESSGPGVCPVQGARLHLLFLDA